MTVLGCPICRVLLAVDGFISRRDRGMNMWCIYRLYFCRRPGCPVCGAGDDYHSDFVEETTSPLAGEDRIQELRQQNPNASYSVRWVYGYQIATA
jgi:hypothetical protein